jgi:hypothetical protein
VGAPLRRPLSRRRRAGEHERARHPRAGARAHLSKLPRHRLSTFLFCAPDGSLAAADAKPASGPALAKAVARGERDIFLRATYVAANADASHMLRARQDAARERYLKDKCERAREGERGRERERERA